MISNRNLAAIKGQAKKSQREKQQIQAKDDGKQEDGGDDVNDIFRTI